MTAAKRTNQAVGRLGTIREVVKSIRGGISVECEERPADPGELGVLKTGTVFSGRLDLTQQKFVPLSEHSRLRTPLRAGTIVICRKNSEDAIGACAFVSTDCPSLFLSDLLWEISPAENVDPRWLLYTLQSAEVRQEIRLRATGTQHSMKNISHDKLLSIPIHIPSYVDQQSIARILVTWDQAMENLDRQIISKARLRGHLRETLISGAHRLERKQVWPTVKLGDVSRPLLTRNGSRYGRDRVMGVTKAAGLVPMKDHVIATDISRYLVLPPQSFAYNPMRINIGSIVMSDADSDVIVSPDYVVFSCLSDRCHPHFLNHLRRTRAWRSLMAIAGNGGVRVRIYYSDLANFKFHLPPLDEQRAIVSILDDADQELETLSSQRHAISSQRSALASELLNGRLRLRQGNSVYDTAAAS